MKDSSKMISKRVREDGIPVVKNSREALTQLWSEGFFKTEKKYKDIELAISKKGCNPPQSQLQVALARADFLTRKGSPPSMGYIQLHNFDERITSSKLTPRDESRIFKELEIHPKILEASGKLFSGGHYSQAIFEAFKELNNMVKEKCEMLDPDGQKLMAQVFRIDAPRLKWSLLISQSERDEQDGFMHLFMGAMTGIRNPRAHESFVQDTKITAIEYLVLASLLAKRVDEAQIVY